MPTYQDEIITYSRLDVANYEAGAAKMNKANVALAAGEAKVGAAAAGLAKDVAGVAQPMQAASAVAQKLADSLKLGGVALAVVAVAKAINDQLGESINRVRDRLKELEVPLRVPIKLGDANGIGSQIDAAKAGVQAIKDAREAERLRPKSIAERISNKVTGIDKTLDDASLAALETEQRKIFVLAQAGNKLRAQDVDLTKHQVTATTSGVGATQAQKQSLEDTVELERQRLAGARQILDARAEEQDAVRQLVSVQDTLLRAQQEARQKELRFQQDEAGRGANLNLAKAQTPIGDRQQIERNNLDRAKLAGDLRGGPDRRQLTDAEKTDLQARIVGIDRENQQLERGVQARQRALDVERKKLQIGEGTIAQRDKIFSLELAAANIEVGFAQTAQQRQEAENRLGDVVRQRIAYKQQELQKEEELRHAFQQRAEAENRSLAAQKEQTLIKGQRNAGNKQTADILEIRLGTADKIREAQAKAAQLDREGDTQSARKVRQQIGSIQAGGAQELDEYDLEHNPRRRAEFRRRQLRAGRDGRAANYRRNVDRADRLFGQAQNDFGLSRASVVASGRTGIAAQQQREVVANTAATAIAVKEAVGFLSTIASRPPLL